MVKKFNWKWRNDANIYKQIAEASATRATVIRKTTETSSMKAVKQQAALATSKLSCIGAVIQGVTGGTDQTSGECSLGQTIQI